MAKGQQRSNRETRKPKKEKVAPKAETPFGAQVKLANSTVDARRKPKA
ncbi:hypothetical protein [Phyllobacterium salinisoli]|nr:hypothetical protein [Phyllobacterium salinisoli]